MALGFLLRCPNCGERGVYEFSFGGEDVKRPTLDASDRDWYGYVYGRKNAFGVQKEWWYHRLGCKRWFLALRDTGRNRVVRTFLAGEDEGAVKATK